MHDARLQLVDDEAVERVDVLATARAKAQVVKPGAILIEGGTALLTRCAAHQDTGAAADAVHDVRSLDQSLHRQKVAELFPEWHTAVGIADGELNVRDAVDFDAHGESST